MSDHFTADGRNPHLTEDGENLHVIVEGGVMEPPEVPEVEEDRFVAFIAERMEAYTEDPSATAQAALAAIQIEATLRLAEEVAKIREALDLNTALATLDKDLLVSRIRMVLKMMANLEKSDAARAKTHEADNFQDLMAGHAAEAQKS